MTGLIAWGFLNAAIFLLTLLCDSFKPTLLNGNGLLVRQFNGGAMCGSFLIMVAVGLTK